jgi:hypothetical protein
MRLQKLDIFQRIFLQEQGGKEYFLFLHNQLFNHRIANHLTVLV